MLERVESLDSARYLKESIADKLISARREDLTDIYGTALRSGDNPTLWKPYHTEENFRVTNTLTTLFKAAQTLHPELKSCDLPAMQIAASLFYPDFDDLYYVDPEFVKKEMTRTGVFGQRDFMMIPGLMKAATLKISSDSPLMTPQIEYGSEFETHQKVFADALGSYKGRPDAMYWVALLAIERLVENNAIRTEEGRLPNNLQEVLDNNTTYDRTVLRNHAKKQEEIFGQTYVHQLSSSREVLPHFAANHAYFLGEVQPMLTANDPDLATLFQATWSFSQRLLKEKALRSKK